MSKLMVNLLAELYKQIFALDREIAQMKARRRAAQDAERLGQRVEEHLVGLEWIFNPIPALRTRIR